MSHARNEGPGGCVPWEEWTATALQVKQLREALRQIDDYAFARDLVMVRHIVAVALERRLEQQAMT